MGKSQGAMTLYSEKRC